MGGIGGTEVVGIVVFTILPVIVLVVLMSLGVRWAVGNGLRDAIRSEETYTRIGGSARGILDRRYADGEISREDYLRMKGDIKKATENTGNRDA